MDVSAGQTRQPGVEKTHRTPPSRTQRAPFGVTTRIARTLRSHTLAFAFIATHAAFLSPLLTHFLRRLSGIRSLHDYDHVPASIRLCCDHDGIRSQHAHDHDHDLAASIRLCREHDFEYEYEHDHAFSASIRLC
jgi:hypothetical protein